MKLESLVRKNVLRLKPYSSARDEYVSDGSRKIFLDANENPFGQGLNRYPDPQQRALKELLGQVRGVPPGSILLGNGSDEVLDLLIRAFCEPGEDRILILPPTYGMYRVLAEVNDVAVDEVLLDLETFQPDLEGIRDKTGPNTKLLFLCSPNNPSGNTMKQESIETLLGEFPGLVVIDEAYTDFSSEPSWIHRLEEFPNLVVTQTFSKAWGLAGVRLGVCYASEAILGILNKIKPPYNINSLTQQKVQQVLEDKEAVKEGVDYLLRERDGLYDALQQCEVVKKVWPSQANFILAKVDDADLRYQQLLDAGVVVRHRGSQPNCDNCLRFTVGTPAENRKLINILKKLNDA